jgi:hypothetical protein
LLLHFQELVLFLKKHQYTVKVRQHKNYKVATVTGNGIRGGFATESIDVYPYINNRICADHFNCFDKWRKCPLLMQLPVNGDELLKHLQFLGSPEGYQVSNSYDYLDNNPFPSINT